MSKFEYTEDMVARMHDVAGAGVTEESIEGLMEEFDFPRRSVTAKLRKLGYDVPKKPGAAPVFSADETDALASFLESNSGNMTAEEIAADFMGGKFTARQINGKALSLEMTSHVKPAEKKITPRTYSDEEEAKITSMVEADLSLKRLLTQWVVQLTLFVVNCCQWDLKLHSVIRKMLKLIHMLASKICLIKLLKKLQKHLIRQCAVLRLFLPVVV